MMVFDAKDPSDTEDFDVGFSKVLRGTDTITGHTVVVTGGDAVLGIHSHTVDTVTFWLSGGTAGSNTLLDVTATTAAGRTIQRSVVVPVRQL